ncbi:hypothetical protein P3T36_004332 [Kitasatospora sp. MAP12-15]|uniref:condensation domain-containing protein n=1 Tax=unclassified Kitasatospora TaxID=2633591 RepID=UPI0024753C86|nr:condensation domain-containing protein [Kitasatospora sp. MAP12-44]MDH6108203.1 hypothetical protein [Kitasatospora sp. MAP12-44]
MDDGTTAETYPLSFGQEKRVLSLGPGRLPNAPLQAWVRISGPLDTGALSRSLRDMTERHAALRVRLVQAPDATMRQVVLPPDQAGITLSKKLVQCDSEDQFGNYAGRLGQALSGRPWDWSAEPPAQFHLLRYSPDFHVLLAQFASFAVDGLSRGVFMRDLWASYEKHRDGAAAGGPRGLPGAGRLGEALNREQTRFSQRSATVNRRYWTNRFSAISASTAPPARADGVTLRPAVTHEARLAGAELEQVRRNCDRESATLCQWSVMCFALMLFQETAADRVAITIPMDTRESQDQDVMGMFSLALPLVVTRSHDPSTVLRSVKNEMMQALLHRHIRARDLVDSGYGSTSAGSERFKLRYLEYLDAPVVTLADGLRLAQEAYPPPVPSYASEGIDFIIGAFPDSLDLSLGFAPEQWDRTRSAAFSAALRARLLTAITP